MEKNTIVKLNKRFEEYAYVQDGIEYWLARELQELLGYSDWRNFLNAINKAKESCETTGDEVSNHFVDVNKMIIKLFSVINLENRNFRFFSKKLY